MGLLRCVLPAAFAAGSLWVHARYELWMGIFGKIAKDVGLKPQ